VFYILRFFSKHADDNDNEDGNENKDGGERQ